MGNNKLIPTAIKMINGEFSSFNNRGVIDHSYLRGWMNTINDCLDSFTNCWGIREGKAFHEFREDRKTLRNYALDLAREWVKENIDEVSWAYDELEEDRKEWLKTNRKEK
jgi:hypothetical protein